jgi:enoyl-CoA hydratase
MAADLVQIERRPNGVAVLTLNDPERLNAMTEAMGGALSASVAALKDEAGLRAVVLTGAGRAFSAGGDLDMLVRMAKAGNADRGGPTRAAQRAFMGRFYRTYLAVRELPVPSIAALNGPAIGAGLCVALACDLRIAAREAKLGLNFTRLGIHPGMAATWTLPRIVGSAFAAELIYTGRIIDGAEAARIGLANRAVPREETVAAALSLAEEIASAAPVAVRGAKRSLAMSGGATLDAQLDQEAAEQALCYESADLLEGLAAVRDKRSPVFRGS